MSVYQEIVEVLLQLSERHIDEAVKPMLEKWSDPPEPIQILEVIDQCVHGSLASGFVVTTLQAMYKMSCEDHNTTHEQVVVNATWRK